MGTTIRRQPVNFDIPASPNYKFLNITNFRGLDVSSNPFELANNTASDCLNVYVDETNTLTTRPRLEKKVTTPESGEHIATYNLHNGYLLHYLQDGKGVMHKLINGTKTEVKGIIPTTKCKYFEQGDKIYLLDRSRYLVIDENNTLSNVVGYVPTTAVVDLNGVRHDVEPLNLLTPRYIEKYNWTFATPITPAPNSTLTIDAFKQSSKGPFGDNTKFVIEEVYDNGVNHVYIKYIDVNYSETTIVDLIEAFGTTSKDVLITAINATNKTFWVQDTSNCKVCVVYKYLGEWKYATITDIISEYSLSDRALARRISADGFEFVMSDQDNGKYIDVYTLKLHDGLFDKVRIETTGLLTYPAEFIGNIVAADGGANGFYIFPQRNKDAIKLEKSYNSTNTHLLSSGEIMHTTQDGLFCINDSATGELISEQRISFPFVAIGPIENYPTSLWLLNKDGEIYSIPNLHNIGSNHTFTGMKILDSIEYLLADTYVTEEYSYFSYNITNKNSSFERITPVAETFIQADTYLADDSIVKKEWTEKRKQFFQSYLNTRFDNNYWLASKNRYYRSANNDPTYFPITEYNDLGDSNEEITGFNLANDTTLIAYKKNRVYLIQPFTSSLDTTEYAITESKNTVGNTAFGSPIVTTLTEIPLQINNDGVYGLSQLSNVSATERIADLMSEPINERWLNIDDTLITNAQTLNRLYWTYIILPDNNNKQTMIYLLDNRSNSWYYWELPIVVSDSFVKDNRAEFVDVAGNIYYLTTTDIIDINYDEEKVTKYYDDGEQLIPWFWQSQVLPMGTMNYSKRLVNTTFILTDTDDSDGYGLQYNFKVFRKLASSTPEKEISDKLTLVRSTTKKTNISKFGFLQMRISNLTEESRDYEAYENNKLRLVGLGLKYVLLEGLIR